MCASAASMRGRASAAVMSSRRVNSVRFGHMFGLTVQRDLVDGDAAAAAVLAEEIEEIARVGRQQFDLAALADLAQGRKRKGGYDRGVASSPLPSTETHTSWSGSRSVVVSVPLVRSTIWVRRASPYFSLMASRSSLMTPRILCWMGQQVFKIGDLLLQFFEFVLQLAPFQRGQPAQLHVQDGLGLHLGEAEIAASGCCAPSRRCWLRRMVAITSSRMSSARSSPSRIWARSRGTLQFVLGAAAQRSPGDAR